MTWTYSGDPGASALDELRFLIGDTNTLDQQLTDEELNYLLGENSGDAKAAAPDAIGALITKYARLCDQTTGDISIKYSQRAQAYRDMLEDLTSAGGLASITPDNLYAGGISKSDKTSVEGDTDRVAPNFSLGMTDNPSALPDDLRED
jgi:hypothetical protein